MADHVYLDSIWAERDGVIYYPYQITKGDKKGKYSVSFSKNNRGIAMSGAELELAVENGKFKDRGLIRMLPKIVKGNAYQSGIAPTHYKGVLIKQLDSGDKSSAQSGSIYPDEISSGSILLEGAKTSVEVNRYERSKTGRKACIDHFGPKCRVCEMEFNKMYGEIGSGFIHVHHLVPLHSIGEGYQLDPIKDLVPVCPNCHAMLHTCEPPLSVEELELIVKNA